MLSVKSEMIRSNVAVGNRRGQTGKLTKNCRSRCGGQKGQEHGSAARLKDLEEKALWQTAQKKKLHEGKGLKNQKQNENAGR